MIYRSDSRCHYGTQSTSNRPPSCNRMYPIPIVRITTRYSTFQVRGKINHLIDASKVFLDWEKNLGRAP
ncbi:hypothetical protein QJS04_geneDACA022152 [Acorus gramineus]|uniref:Uncharacterized protein n=1 Tax=Acorus gramineus TaxID=55184 RepID=A0AAV9BM75_ACOGR|nr:hypothetical protein QJS04_geneDACA022152 [Acorus gramineus]